MTSSIRSRKHSPARFAALAALAATAPISAHADAAFDAADSAEVVVKGERQGFKATTTTSDKRTQPILDTPQTLTVITSEVIRQQGATTLTDALRNTPGITIQLGENGNTSAGDTFQLRGFAAQTSLFLDGVRDLGAVTRDTFNIGQIEVAKGPAGSEFGRGASSGYINLVSKLPYLAGGSSATASLYSAGGYRATADADMPTGETGAVRLNAFSQDIDAPGRDYVKKSAWGVAPSFATGLGTDTRFYVFGQIVQQDNVPDGGIPTIGYDGYDNITDTVLKAGARVDRENFYGSVNDYEKIEAAMISGKFEHDFASGVKLSNVTRYGTSNMDRILTGVNTGGTGMNSVVDSDPSTWTVNLSRQRVDQENTILANQTNLRGTWTTGSVTHDLSGGVEISHESQFNRTYATSYNTGPTTVVSVTVPAASLYNPDPMAALPDPLLTGAYTDGETTTLAGYLFDTVKLNEQWLINGGVRVDSYTTKTNGARRAVAADAPIPVGTLVPVHLDDGGTVVSWNAGVVYKPVPNASLYAALGTSVTPPGTANFTLSETATNISSPNLDPQETSNFEIGTKWDLFDARLALTAAYYNTRHKNEIVVDIDPGAAISASQFGERKVEGIELGAVGKITDKWDVIAGIATMDTEVLEGSTGNNAEGAAARWSPDLTANLWTTYKVTPKLTLAIGGNYTSEQLRVVAPGSAPSTGLSEIPSYWLINAMASYAVTERVGVQMNIYNLFDEDYITTLNNGGGRVIPGAPLNGILTLNVKF